MNAGCTWLGGAAALLGVALAGYTEPSAAAGDAAHPPAPAPSGCRTVAAGEPVQPILDASADGASICLAAGAHQGPLRVSSRITLWGPPEAVVRTGGAGTTIAVSADGAALVGFSIDGTGGRYDHLDAAVHVEAADVRVEGLSIERAAYGIVVEKSRRVLVRGNHVRGDVHDAMGLRGDPIRLWETTDSVVEANLIEDGRDIVVWYSKHNQIRDNEVRGGRYGTHLMYSHETTVERNTYRGGVVGVFVMYSHAVTLRDNLIADAAGAAGMAIGLKDSGDITVQRNVLVHDAVGLYLDQSPVQIGEQNLIEGNAFRLCDTAVVFHASERRNRFHDNDFADNGAQLRVDGGGDATEVVWDGNYFDDYDGYDLDEDGVGDVPYELRSLAADLTSRHPNLAFFHGAPALGLADVAAKVVPMLQPRTMLVEPRPRMAARPLEEVRDAR